jgi:hypothetical protein
MAKTEARKQELDDEIYKAAKADLEFGLGGVQKILEVVREYCGSAEAAFCAFMPQPAKPSVHLKSGGAGGSIIAILEVCESDFSKCRLTCLADKTNYRDFSIVVAIDCFVHFIHR